MNLRDHVALDEATVEMALATSSTSARRRYFREERHHLPAYDTVPVLGPRDWFIRCQNPECGAKTIVRPNGPHRRYCAFTCQQMAWYWRHRETALAKRRAYKARVRLERRGVAA